MKNFLNTKTKKIIIFIVIIGAIEFSGHGIFASLFRFLGSLDQKLLKIGIVPSDPLEKFSD